LAQQQFRYPLAHSRFGIGGAAAAETRAGKPPSARALRAGERAAVGESHRPGGGGTRKDRNGACDLALSIRRESIVSSAEIAARAMDKERIAMRTPQARTHARTGWLLHGSLAHDRRNVHGSQCRIDRGVSPKSWGKVASVRCRCGRDEPSAGADVAGASPNGRSTENGNGANHERPLGGWTTTQQWRSRKPP
jgi:hypothetical protein